MERIPVNDFANYHFLSGLAASPDGDHLCFVTHKANLDDNNYASNLWVYSVKTQRLLQLTSFNQEKGFIWLDDSEHILFSSIRDEKDKKHQMDGAEFTVFYRINILGGEAQEAFRIPFIVNQIKQLDHKRFLFLATYNRDTPPLEYIPKEDREEECKRRKENEDYQVLEEIPYWSNGEGFVSRNRSRLYLMDIGAGQWESLTDGQLHIEDMDLNSDRSKVVLTGKRFCGRQPVTNALYLLSISDCSLHQLTSAENFVYEDPRFITDTKIICRANDMERYGLNENSRFYLVDGDGGQQQLLTPDFQISTWNSVGSDCKYGNSESVKVAGGHLYYVTTEGASSYLSRINIDGHREQLTTAGGTVDSYAVYQDKVWLIGLRGLALQELYSLERDGEKQVSHFNDQVLSNRSLAPLEPISCQTETGVTIDGWVIKPIGWEASRSYPAILTIHGGPKTVYGAVFYHEMQYWANQGYFVFFCNPRGSDGKGNTYADIRGKYGTIDYQDIMTFTDTVLEHYPSMNQDKLGVTGGSYGGYMTNWIIGHTQRFKAAVSQRSISNWVSMACTADIGYFFVEDQMAGMPWSDQEALWDYSPLKYADQVQTPTLFIHSEEDYRCWLVEGLQMFTALKYHGVESRLCMFRGENHELSRSGKPKHRIRRLEEITSWFNRYLKDN